MKARMAAPPIIIMLDILMQYLMVFMAQTQPQITMSIPEDIIFKGGKIVSIDSGVLKYFDGQKFVAATRNNFGESYIQLPCNTNICSEAKKINNNVSIAITGKLLDDLSKVTFISCNTNASSCNNLIFDIKSNGKIDANKFFEKNPVFKGVSGLQTYLSM